MRRTSIEEIAAIRAGRMGRLGIGGRSTRSAPCEKMQLDDKDESPPLKTLSEGGSECEGWTDQDDASWTRWYILTSLCTLLWAATGSAWNSCDVDLSREQTGCYPVYYTLGDLWGGKSRDIMYNIYSIFIYNIYREVYYIIWRLYVTILYSLVKICVKTL